MTLRRASCHGGGYDTGRFERGGDAPRGRFSETGRFGRMLPYLRSLRAFRPGPEELGRADGPMNGGAGFDPTQDNPRIKAGYTFLGQFIDHDLTLDATSVLEQQIDPGATRNFRTPALELDSLYGLGPKVQPHLYDSDSPGRMLLSEDGFDLPRNRQGTALIGDPRNDENVIISQLHLLFLKFHNKVYDGTDPELGDQERFERAQRLVRWHYQWLVVNEFLPRTVGRRRTRRAMRDLPFRYAEGQDAFMPVEFSVAAYRFGHSQVRPGYLLSAPGVAPPRVAALFPPAPDAPPGVGDLRGGRPVPAELRVDWAAFFGTAAQASKLIDIRISTPLLVLPDTVVDPGSSPTRRSLASRNLQRGIDARLPSGQAAAAFFGARRLSEAQIWKDVDGGEGDAPLWFYCLREAEALADGMRLAGVGGRIVANTFAAILDADKASYPAQQPGWTPTLGRDGTFTVADLVNFTLGTALEPEDVDALPGETRAAPVPEPVPAE
jgi:hypothetical protein